MDPVVREYVRYLESLVKAEQQSSPYSLLLAMMWGETFEGYVPNDENREEDGIKLRREFETKTSNTLPLLGQCRFLEFLIALAIRFNAAVYDYEYPNMTAEYFWTMVENVGLDEFDDYYSGPENPAAAIRAMIRDVVGRNYDYNGSDGGLFPLQHARNDQRNVEVWYQLMEYINENYDF